MPEEPDVSPEELKILDEVWRKRVEAKEQQRADEALLVADRIFKVLQARPEGMTFAEIREMFDEKLSDKQLRQALLTLETTPLPRTKVEKNGDHSGERWALLVASY